MKKCKVCKKTIVCEEGFYNYPSGAMHTKCGKNKAKKIETMRKKHGLMYAISMESTIK